MHLLIHNFTAVVVVVVVVEISIFFYFSLLSECAQSLSLLGDLRLNFFVSIWAAVRLALMKSNTK